MPKSINRREFIKLAALGLGGSFLTPLHQLYSASSAVQNRSLNQTILDILDSFPSHPRLARVVDGKVDLKTRPDVNSESVGVLYENAVIPWVREIVGTNPYRFVQRFVETPQGYIWSPHLQMVANLPDPHPAVQIPQFEGGPGMWVEVSVPFVDLVIANPPVRSPAFRNGVPQRLYYQQVVWVDEISQDENGVVWYRVNERFGSYGDIFRAPGKAFRILTPEMIAPISPEVENKSIVINVNEDVQTLVCYEGETEVYFCRISAGKRYDIEGNYLELSATPLGRFPTWRKLWSIHMSGGASGVGWDLMGVAWATFFATPGIAIHSTFWHNNFGGEYMSRGCVNLTADDAKWVFRWTQPSVSYQQGDVTVQMPGGTQVRVLE